LDKGRYFCAVADERGNALVINIDTVKTQAEKKSASDQLLQAGGNAPGDMIVSSDKINLCNLALNE